mmetsp:Transcript_8339/g.15469  ORF Transcript_8339/g.15469 Transcript_8339/m.15469 type:complete len:153 (+) Transcript_8339:57-515(+)|eukprot:CAMPEP_0197535570 /NCGR_PEP_ID=MMETSP1318-20131121/51057_1 /TAXON_ID=552666 /ORGANISM="Partenskyella glossopodia, Strain RCC365" /LENGTH=152 /DNA_ID=CAMNT_0043093189 /DNA_START=44 /DNA_END=502 /DNA_ORIENTATION=+
MLRAAARGFGLGATAAGAWKLSAAAKETEAEGSAASASRGGSVGRKFEGKLKITVLGAKWCGYSRKFFDELKDDWDSNVIQFVWVDEKKDAKPPNENLPMPQGYPTSYLCNFIETKCLVVPGYVSNKSFEIIAEEVSKHLQKMEEAGDQDDS